jgi:hypothetical protein
MYRCPECGSDNLEVTVETWATLVQTKEGAVTDTTTAFDGSHEWGDNSVMRCRDCDAQEIAERFETDAGDSPSSES